MIIKNHIQQLEGITFYSANELVKLHGASANLANKIKDQPGYRPLSEMKVAKTKFGFLRLFVKVGSSWLDGSLNDLN